MLIRVTRLMGRGVAAVSVALAVLGGCAGLEVHSVADPGQNFDGYGRFDFLPLSMPGPGESNPDPINNRVLGRRLQAAIAATLVERGYARVDTHPDFSIGVQVATREKLEIYGGGGPFSRTGAGFGTTFVDSYTEGTLIIEVVDVSRGELVWQGWASQPLDRADPSDERLRQRVGQILARFPPSTEKPE